jgi:hypothetical protein
MLIPYYELFHLNKHEHLKKSVGQAVSQRLQPTQSSVRGDEAICLLYNLSKVPFLVHQ